MSIVLSVELMASTSVLVVLVPSERVILVVGLPRIRDVSFFISESHIGLSLLLFLSSSVRSFLEQALHVLVIHVAA